jgi:hypothetical protein
MKFEKIYKDGKDLGRDWVTGKICEVMPGVYTGLDARLLLHELNDFCGVGAEKLIYMALLHNPNNEDLSINLKTFFRYDDMSGHYSAVIEHENFPEGFKMEIDTGLDSSFKVFQWGYGGG